MASVELQHHIKNKLLYLAMSLIAMTVGISN